MKKYLLAGMAVAAATALSAPAEARGSISITVGSGGYEYPGYGYGYDDTYDNADYDSGYYSSDDDYGPDIGYGYPGYRFSNYDSYNYRYAPAPYSRNSYRYERRDRNYRCGDGTTGAIVGGAGGALIGRAIGRGGSYYSRNDGTVGAIIGGAAGALLGREVGRSC